MVIKSKSHSRVTYLDTNNFYWAIDSVYGSNLESGNLAKRFHTNNQQKCVDCLKPRSDKYERNVKNVVVITFMCLIIKVFHL